MGRMPLSRSVSHAVLLQQNDRQLHRLKYHPSVCGDLREGFARVRCPDCRREFYVAYSCKQRCVCSTCHQKRSPVTTMHIAQDISAPVPHRQFVFTMPKRFRIYFRFNRDLLRLLPPLAWETVRDIYRATLNQPDANPGMNSSASSSPKAASRNQPATLSQVRRPDEDYRLPRRSR